MTSETIIARCKDLHKSYVLDSRGKAELHVLKGISLEVIEGDFISIVGASGSGKSSFLHVLGGLDRPSGGEVWWKNENIFTISEEHLARLRARHVGFIFQFHHLMPEFTALENVIIPQMIMRVSKSDAARRGRELLSRVGLEQQLDRRPGELSGGEQQRVAVARALANRPKLILADEPSGNLDSASSEQLHELLLELNRSENQAFVVVTHNERFAEQSRRVFRMMDGILHPR